MESLNDIIIPILTAVSGFFGGMKYSNSKNSRVQRKNKIDGDNNIFINGDVNGKN